MSHDPTRDCEHGRLKGKCDVCDLQAEVLEQCRIIAMDAEREDALRAELTRLKASIALDKKADNARELGLSYDDEPARQDVPETNFGNTAAQPAVQEPVGEVSGHDWSTGLLYRDLEPGTPLYTAPQPVPVKTYHDGKPWPVAPKPWVGLTDEDIEQGWNESWVDKQAFESAVWWAEKKLKEKNHDQ